MSTNAVLALQKITGKKLSVGNFLWSIRMCDQKPQSELAKELGISVQYLSDLEKGRRLLSPKKAKAFAEILGYLPEQFIELAVRDMLARDGIHMTVQLKSAA